MESDVETPLTYSLGFKTDRGQQRAHNEDAGAVFEVPGMDAAFVVCDGMGGLRAGEVASNEAVRVVQETVKERIAAGETDPFKTLGEAFRRANDAVNTLNRAEQGVTASTGSNAAPPTAGRSTEGPDALMGTTGVAGLVLNNTAYIAHAGDSRAYRWRRGNLTRLTEDHTFVAERVRAGDMTEAQARVSKYRNIVIKGIGIAETVEPDFRAEPLEPGDTILVCSDGLTTMLDDADIAGLMNAPSFLKTQPDRAAQVLVDAANKKGGQDNITVMLMRAAGSTGDTMPTAITLDADAPRPPRRSPLPWILLGIVLALLAAAAALMFSRPIRQAVIEFLDTREEKVAVRRGERLAPLPEQDYAKLAYDPPERFATYAARGDILSYAPGVGLYFAAEGTGKVALLDAKGKALRSVEKLEIVDARVSDPSATRVFMTSDPQGNVYFSYTKKRMIVKRGPDGKLLRTITGFELPEAIAIDEQGNIFVVDFNEIKVCRARLPRPDEDRSSAKPTPKPSPT
jgi:PPM family protein phosphatase